MEDITSEYNVLDVLLMRKKKYIILFSGLDFSPVEQIVNDLSKDFNSTVLNFIHLGLEDSLDPVNNRVNDLINKSNPTKALFIIGKTFPSSKLKIPVDLHIHISLHQIAILKLDPLKRQDLPTKYVESIKTNRVNKYINLQKDYSIDKIEDEIFSIIVDDIEKKVYGDQYETLGSKSSNTQTKPAEVKPTSSQLSFDPNVPSIKELKEEVTKKAEDEIKDSIDSAEDSLSAEKELDDSSDDFLSEEVRVLGSGHSFSTRRKK
jgi:hypothetical protein